MRNPQSYRGFFVACHKNRIENLHKCAIGAFRTLILNGPIAHAESSVEMRISILCFCG